MSKAKFQVKVYLKSGQIVEFVTDQLKHTGSSFTWERDNAHSGPKLLQLDSNQVAAITYE